QAVIAIENVRLFKELDARNRELTEALEQQTATAEMLRVISRSPTDIDPVLEAVVESVARLCDSPDVTIFRIEGGVLQLAVHRGPIGSLPPYGEERVPWARGTPVGRSVIERRTIHLVDLSSETDEYPEGSARARSFGNRAVLSVPLLRDDEAIGAIAVRRTEARLFTERQIALLQTFADQAVIAIENVRLFKELQAKNRELTTALDQQTATSEILRAISSSLTDVQPVFNTIVESGLRLLGGYSASMMLCDNDGLDLVAYTSTSDEADASLIHAFPLPLHRIPPGERAVHERRAHAVEDIESATNVTDVMREASRTRGWRSNLFVPMIRDDVAVGLISITRREPGPFAADQIALLEIFAAQAVIAIENVRLFNELQASNKHLTEALDKQTATSEILRAISSSPTNVQPVFEAILSSAIRLMGAEAGVLTQIVGDHLDLAAFKSSDSVGEATVRKAFPLSP